ncbi:MAG: hypothetical protein LBQ34_04935 [Alphaproteobacteria bacterium]|jgi:hypothetical protein|nr:hypothetical protein [Alphaproteobacteria bacterium]
MAKYTNQLMDRIYEKYEDYFTKIRSDNFSKNELKEQNNEIANYIKDYAEVLADINKTDSSIEYKKEAVKEFLNFELKLNEISSLNLDGKSGEYRSLEESKGNLDNTLDTYDRDMVDSDNYQAVYTRNKRKKSLTSEGLPKDDVVFLLHSQLQKIKMGEVVVGANTGHLLEINQARRLVIMEVSKIYKAVQSSLLKDVLPKEQEKSKKKSRNNFER